MALEDMRLGRLVHREITKRWVDTSKVEVKVVSGVAYLSGEVGGIRGQTQDIESEIETIEKLTRMVPGIRDVVNQLKPALR